MFERFSDGSRRVVVLSQEHSRALGHDYIGAEHLLLAVASLESGPTHAALETCGVSLDALTAVVTAAAPPAAKTPHGHIPFTKEAKKVLEGSLRKAIARGDKNIGAEHLLASLLARANDDGSIVAKVLADLKVDPNEIADALDAALDEDEPISGSPRRRRAQRGPAKPRRLRTPGLKAAQRFADGLAAGTPTGTHHLLAAFLAQPDSAAGRILAAGGFDVTGLPSPPEQWDVAGTTDDTPVGRAERAVRVEVTNDEVTIRITDRNVARAIREASAEGTDRSPVGLFAELLGPLFASTDRPEPDEQRTHTGFTFTVGDPWSAGIEQQLGITLDDSPEQMAAKVRSKLGELGRQMSDDHLAELVAELQELLRRSKNDE